MCHGLHQAGADVNIARSATATLRATGNEGYVALLIQAGADVNMTVSLPVEDYPEETFSNITPLFIAVQQGHTPCVMELIKAGADVNTLREVRIRSLLITPLCIAAYNGHEGCVVLLIQAGADIHKAANDGCTPLSVAVHQKHEKIAALLRHFGGAR